MPGFNFNLVFGSGGGSGGSGGGSSSSAVSGVIDTILDYEGEADGVTSDHAAIAAMAAALGFVVFPAGRTTFIGEDFTLEDVTLHFETEARISVPAGVTVEFNDCQLNAGRHQIFDGEGTILLTDEATVETWADHWGMRSGRNFGDQGAPMARMFRSMTNTREHNLKVGTGIFLFDTNPGLMPRGLRIRGSGERISHFKLRDPSLWAQDFLVSGGVAVHVEDIQISPMDGDTDAMAPGTALIRLQHTDCQATRIHALFAHVGVSLEGKNCKAKSIHGHSYIEDEGGAVVRSQASDCVMEDIHYRGVSRIARVVGVDSGSVETRVRGVRGENVNYGVHVINDGGLIDNPDISDVIVGETAVTPVMIESTADGGTVEDVSLSDINSDQHTGPGVHIRRGGSGAVRGISVNDFILRGGTEGVKIEGTTTEHVENVTIGGHDISGCSGAGIDIDAEGVSVGSGSVIGCAEGVNIDIRSDNVTIAPGRYENTVNFVDNTSDAKRIVLPFAAAHLPEFEFVTAPTLAADAFERFERMADGSIHFTFFAPWTAIDDQDPSDISIKYPGRQSSSDAISVLNAHVQAEGVTAAGRIYAAPVGGNLSAIGLYDASTDLPLKYSDMAQEGSILIAGVIEVAA